MVKEGLETQGSGSCAWEISSSETGMLTHDCGKGIPACWRPLDWRWGGVVTAPLLHRGGLLPPSASCCFLSFPYGRSIFHSAFRKKYCGFEL